MPKPLEAERKRLAEDAARKKNWKRWGPYLAERQWGTVREDYSPDGDCWNYLPHDHARSRAYRWGEDGLLGFTDRQCRLCFALALWNGNDPILKERLFGLNGPEGNHGEDVKELYYYLDSTPTHSYAKALYKYPQAAYPYDELVRVNAERSRDEDEYELIDTGVFDDDRYFDVFAEYAKAGPNDLCIQITIKNHGPTPAPLHVLPTLWFRNTWVWGCEHEGCTLRPDMRKVRANDAIGGDVKTDHETLGKYRWHVAPAPESAPGSNGKKPPLLFTENLTNEHRLFGADNLSPYVKDAFHRRVIDNDRSAINPKNYGTKCAAWYQLNLAPAGSAGDEVTLRFRLHAESETPKTQDPLGPSFTRVFNNRLAEADAYFDTIRHKKANANERAVLRQADAGLLWTKQFYHYVVEDWLDGDPNQPTPPASRQTGRNHDWRHLFSRDVLSMPDKWEYPWFAAWDSAFHMLPFAKLDPDFAKRQLLLFLREWYMHPNGQIPAYEFAFNDVNPPVHAWACWRVYKMTAPRGKRDKQFLASAFQKLLINFTWWVNRKDPSGRNLFSGGFLGLDNIGVFDRSQPLPTGGHLEQADATAWMAFYCSTMLAIALELAVDDRAYADMASKFFEHFVHIATAMNTLGGDGLWDEQDGFYYDQLMLHDRGQPLRVRSLVGLMPLIAVEVLDQSRIDQLPGFRKRMDWFLQHRGDLAKHISYLDCDTSGAIGKQRYLLAIPSRQRLEKVLRYMLDENEFLSPFGIRSLSKHHEQHPYVFQHGHARHEVRYEPGESRSELFGGNSNWRGPIWFPVNYLLIEALQRYHHFYGDSFTVECPTGSGHHMTLGQVAHEIERRLVSLFIADRTGDRPCHGHDSPYANRKGFEDLVLFHEYFHGDTGHGLGASHQTGWTALITRCFHYLVERR